MKFKSIVVVYRGKISKIVTVQTLRDMRTGWGFLKTLIPRGLMGPFDDHCGLLACATARALLILLPDWVQTLCIGPILDFKGEENGLGGFKKSLHRIYPTATTSTLPALFEIDVFIFNVSSGTAAGVNMRYLFAKEVYLLELVLMLDGSAKCQCDKNSNHSL